MAFYSVQFGDSPAIIAKKMGVTVPSLLGANPQKKVVLVANQYTWTALQPGETLAVPGIPTPGLTTTTDPTSATVVTHDPPPAGDLTVHSAPYGHTIGAIDKNAIVQVLQWNADGGNAWAKVSSSGGRHPAVVGFSNRKYLAAVGAPTVAQAARYNPATDTVKVGTSGFREREHHMARPHERFHHPYLSGVGAPPTRAETEAAAEQAKQLLALLQRDQETMYQPSYVDQVANASRVPTSSSTSSDPKTASVTTHDLPPAGDLTIHASPHGQVIGAADKNGVVTVLQWDGDGKHEWAKVAWTGGRHPAVTGYANRKYLAGHSATGVGDPADVAHAGERGAQVDSNNGPAAPPGGFNPSGDPLVATVTTHDLPPAGDLTVHSTPGGTKIGGIDKNAAVQVLQWNADGNNGWARVSSGAGRNAAVTGYANRKYLSAGGSLPPSLAQAAAASLGPVIGQMVAPFLSPDGTAAAGANAAAAGAQIAQQSQKGQAERSAQAQVPETQAAATQAPSVPDPPYAVVTTHDQPPSGDLTIHDAPGSPTVIGAADKSGLLKILQWNADGNGKWAQVQWGGGRHPAATGYSNRKYLVPSTGDVAAQQAAAAQAAQQAAVQAAQQAQAAQAAAIQAAQQKAAQDALQKAATNLAIPNAAPQVIPNAAPATPAAPGGGGKHGKHHVRPDNLSVTPPTTTHAGMTSGAMVAAALGVAALVGVVGYALAKGGKTTVRRVGPAHKPAHHRRATRKPAHHKKKRK